MYQMLHSLAMLMRQRSVPSLTAIHGETIKYGDHSKQSTGVYHIKTVAKSKHDVFKRQLCSGDYQKVNYMDGLYGVAILLTCVLFSSFLTLLPQHNMFENPEYWYEYLININLGYTLHLTLRTIFDCEIVLNYPDIKSFKVFINVFGSS